MMMRAALLSCLIFLCTGPIAMAQELGDFETYKDAVIDLYGDSLYDVLDTPAAYHREVARLPKNVPEITAANMLILEVKNGGFWQYFYNSYGITIHEAIRGLQRTENTEYARLAGEAAARFPGGVPEDRGARIALVGEQYHNGQIRFDDLDKQFYAVPGDIENKYWESFEALARRVLKENAN